MLHSNLTPDISSAHSAAEEDCHSKEGTERKNSAAFTKTPIFIALPLPVAALPTPTYLYHYPSSYLTPSPTYELMQLPDILFCVNKKKVKNKKKLINTLKPLRFPQASGKVDNCPTTSTTRISPKTRIFSAFFSKNAHFLAISCTF